jgi:hypothetical protein
MLKQALATFAAVCAVTICLSAPARADWKADWDTTIAAAKKEGAGSFRPFRPRLARRAGEIRRGLSGHQDRDDAGREPRFLAAYRQGA